MNKKSIMILLISFIPILFSQINAQSIEAKLGGNTDAVNFDVKDSDETTLLRVQGDGKVGIGKTDPDSLLDVEGTTKTKGLMLPTDASNGRVLTSDGSGNATWQTPVADGDWTVSGNDLYNNNSGNIGVGTSSPDSLLDVDGTIKTRGFMMPTGAEDGAHLKSDADGNAIWYLAPIDSLIDYYKPIWDSTETGSHIYNLNAGNIGIGTETPNELLTVEGVISLDEQATAPSHTAGYGKLYVKDDEKLYFKNSSGEETDVSAETNISISNIEAPHWDSTATGSHIFNENAGNVGIGTITPTQKLDVNGTVKANYFLGDGSLLTNLPPTSSLWSNNSFNPDNIYYATGNVGIGGEDATEKLHVVGNVKIVDGNQGSGKILTSDATGIGNWQPAPSLGAWSGDLPADSTIQATTDGFVVAWGAVNPDEIGWLRGYTGSTSPDDIIIQSVGYSEFVASITFPVRKGDYWKVTITEINANKIRWIPFGN